GRGPDAPACRRAGTSPDGRHGDPRSCRRRLCRFGGVPGGRSYRRHAGRTHRGVRLGTDAAHRNSQYHRPPEPTMTMLRLATSSLRFRLGRFTAPFISVFLGAIVLTAFASLFDTATAGDVSAADRSSLTTIAG